MKCKISGVLLLLAMVAISPVFSQEVPYQFSNPKYTASIQYFPATYKLGSVPGFPISVNTSNVVVRGEARVWPRVYPGFVYISGSGTTNQYNTNFGVNLFDMELHLKIPLDTSKFISETSVNRSFPYEEQRLYFKAAYRSSQYHVDANSVRWFSIDSSGYGAGLGLTPNPGEKISAFGGITYYPTIIVHNVTNPAPNTEYYRSSWDFEGGARFRLSQQKDFHFDLSYKAWTYPGMDSFQGVVGGFTYRF
ncbi:MAG: hypothetical protein HYU64_09110 [Armatimonadetes bacterium]|nr:hypothetical protein [Armatimonadota bacterium]